MAASFNVNYFPPLQMQPTTIKPNELRQSLCCSIRISSVSFGLSPQNQDEVARKPKLFFVSTSSKQPLYRPQVFAVQRRAHPRAHALEEKRDQSTLSLRMIRTKSFCCSFCTSSVNCCSPITTVLIL